MTRTLGAVRGRARAAPVTGTPPTADDRGVGTGDQRGRAVTVIWDKKAVWVPPVIALAVAAVAWQLYADTHPFVIPELPDVFAELGDRPGFYLRNARITLQEIAIGAGGGMITAFVLAVAMSQFSVVERALMPLAVVLNATPVIAVAPGLVVAFGFGLTPKYIVTALIVFFPFLINTLAGLREADPQILNVLRTLSATRMEVLWRVRLPSSLPYVFAATRICMPLSVIGAVVAEFSAPGRAAGLGTLIVTAASVSDLPTIYASVFILAGLGLLLTALAVVPHRWYVARHGLASHEP